MNELTKLEQTLQKKLSSIDEKYILKFSEVEKSKIAGMKKGLEESIVFMKNKSPMTDEKISSFFNFSIRKSIYSLMKNEEKYATLKSERLVCKIAYYESLIETFQLLRESFLEELKET